MADLYRQEVSCYFERRVLLFSNFPLTQGLLLLLPRNGIGLSGC